jgi:hypothetical protein
MDNKTPVAEVIASAAKEAGAGIELANFERFQLGEGIEKAGKRLRCRGRRCAASRRTSRSPKHAPPHSIAVGRGAGAP